VAISAQPSQIAVAFRHHVSMRECIVSAQAVRAAGNGRRDALSWRDLSGPAIDVDEQPSADCDVFTRMISFCTPLSIDFPVLAQASG